MSAFFGVLLVFANFSYFSAENPSNMVVCVFGETQMTSSLYSFERSAAAPGMAIEHANDHICPQATKLLPIT